MIEWCVPISSRFFGGKIQNSRTYLEKEELAFMLYTTMLKKSTYYIQIMAMNGVRSSSSSSFGGKIQISSIKALWTQQIILQQTNHKMPAKI